MADRSSSSSLSHLPTGRWRFDQGVEQVFDDMLQRSIPEYESMRRLVFEVGRPFAVPGTTVLDLGCSRGEALAPFAEALDSSVRLVGVDISQPMLAAARRRFAKLLQANEMEIVELDLRHEYPDVDASLTLSILTLQFIPVEHRHRLVQEVFDHTIPGGALVLVEKVIGSSAAMEKLLSERYRSYKASTGYSEETIERKRLSLEGVLVPLTAAWTEDMLRQAGFSEVECFWRCLNFAGWLALRG